MYVNYRGSRRQGDEHESEKKYIKILIYSGANVVFHTPVSLSGPGVEGGRRRCRRWAANGKRG